MAFGSIWKFGADNSEYKQAVREMPSEMDKAAAKIEQRSKQMAGKMSSVMGELGNIIAGGALAAGMNQLLQKFDDISDMAKRFGTSAESIQKVAGAAEVVGTNIDSVARAMDKVGVQANKAAREGGSLAEAFARVNLDPAAVAAAGLEERVRMIAQAQQNANGDAQKMAELYEVIGIKAAGINFAELASEMERVSFASESTVDALAEAADHLTRAKTAAAAFGAELMKAIITDPAERIGNLIGSGGKSFATNAEANRQMMEEAAKAKLAREGKLLASDSSTSIGGRILNNIGDAVFPGGNLGRRLFLGERGATLGNVSAGPNDIANAKMVADEVARMKAELAAAEASAKGLEQNLEGSAEATQTAAEKAERLKEIKNEIKELEYEIRKAQLEGNTELQKQLEEAKMFLEELVNNEGNYGEAVNSVNRELELRTKELNAQVQKQREVIEQELKFQETMATGNEEQKAHAKWMREYNKQLKDGADYNQAIRSANLQTYEDQLKSEEQMSRGGGADSFSSSAARGAREPSFFERVAQMQGDARASRYFERAGNLSERGLFSSAVKAEMRGELFRQTAMDDARVKDFIRSNYEFAGRKAQNLGEAFDDFKRMGGGLGIADRLAKNMEVYGLKYDRTKGQEANFKELLKAQSLTPEGRAKAEQMAKDEAAGGSGSKSSMGGPATEKTLQQILNKIKERPILVA